MTERRQRFRLHRQRDGFVLLLTVMLLAVTTLIVVGLSRQSLYQATTAKGARQRLQEKWAVASCQRFCLAHGSEILSSSKVRRTQITVPLSGMTIVNEIQDESAKLDINGISDHVSRIELARTVRDVAQTSGLTVRLTPSTIGTGEALRRDYESWGQIFTSRNRDSYWPTRKAADRLTCWGHRINVHRAEPEVLRVAIKTVAGAVMAERILNAREEKDDAPLAELLRLAEVNQRQSSLLTQLLADRSYGTSVWTDVIGEHRTSHYLTVQQRPLENLFRYQTFQW